MKKQKITGQKKSRILQNSVFVLAMVILLVFLVFSVLLAITFGNADISFKDVYGVVLYEIFHIKKLSAFSEGAIHDVVWLIRFPRILLAMSVGIGLAVCGVVMQAIVKNPLADPYILGVSSGASLGATLAIMLGIGSFIGGNFVGIMAFVGAMITSFAVMAISRIGGRVTSAKLILSGTAISAVCSAASNFVIYITNDKEASQKILYWTMGSFSGATWGKVQVLLPVVVICTLIFWTQYRSLNLMLLGDEVSVTLGTDLQRIRIVYLVIASVMVGFAVYAAGMIGFVGLVIPHVIRLIFGTDHRKLVPLSALLGGILLVWADVASRSILKNAEMPIGILISLIGAPCFIYLLVRKSYGFGGENS